MATNPYNDWMTKRGSGMIRPHQTTSGSKRIYE
jgi:hypothetical protein